MFDFECFRKNSFKLIWALICVSNFFLFVALFFFAFVVYLCCVFMLLPVGITTTLLYPFNGLFSRTAWVSRHQKGKRFWILLEQEMMWWQWHQLDHMQIICTLLQTDNHSSNSPLSFLQAECPSCRPSSSVKALKA